MGSLIFDIETIGHDFDSLDDMTKHILTRDFGNDRESELYQQKLAELIKSMNFNPLLGEIVAIGVLDSETRRGAVYYQAPNQEQIITEDDGVKLQVMTEEEIIRKFWELAKKYDEIVSFNGRSFDIPYIIHRSLKYRIKPTKNYMQYGYLARMSSNCRHVDLARELSFNGVFRSRGSLHLWCRHLGINSPKTDGVSGDNVTALFNERKYEDIARYNIRDIRATCELFNIWKENLL